MGKHMPPLYGIEDIFEQLDEISKIDEKINALLIEREKYVTDFKKAISEADTNTIKD